MPTAYPGLMPIDAANIASKLPSPFQWAGGAALEGAKQLVGGDDPNNAVMGAVSPLAMAGEGSLFGDLAASAGKKIKSIQHPAMQELLWLLGNVKSENPESALQGQLLSRMTPKHGLPPQAISAPEGFTFEGLGRKVPVAASPNTERFLDWKSKTDPTRDFRLSRRQGTGLLNPETANRFKRAGLSEDMIRDIRTISDLPTAQSTYPHLKPETIKGILRGDTWGWVK